MDRWNEILSACEHIIAVSAAAYACWRVCLRVAGKRLDDRIDARLNRIEWQVTPNGGESSSLADTNIRQTGKLDALIAEHKFTHKRLWLLLILFSRVANHIRRNDLQASVVGDAMDDLISHMTAEEKRMFEDEMARVASHAEVES